MTGSGVGTVAGLAWRRLLSLQSSLAVSLLITSLIVLHGRQSMSRSTWTLGLRFGLALGLVLHDRHGRRGLSF